jgi:hypothetical protein
MATRTGLPVFLMAIMLLPGCGRPSLARVKGRVTCNGKPVANAHLTFSPVPRSEGDLEAGKPATGFTDAEGSFVLSTYKPRDGALIGQHRVAVTLDDINPARCKRLTHLVRQVGPGDNDLTVELNE